MALVTLITDFGLEDEYVGLMKGAILTLDPQARIVDVTHAVTPGDVEQAAFMLAAAYPYFPAGSIHLVVVDPGVGTERRLLCLACEGRIFLAPDNGVLTFPLVRAEGLWCIDDPAFRRDMVSATFHGRDILAPAAGHLSRGLPPHRLGPAAAPQSAVRLDGLEPDTEPDGTIRGRIVHIDRFGNLVTNIARHRLAADPADASAGSVSVRIGGRTLSGIRETYGRVPVGEPLALFGSRGFLEIAVNRGSAREYFGCRRGDPVRVRP